MADISKITLPNGQSYNIKDTTARNTGRVSGVKGNAENSYRTGNVNITPENIGAFKQEQYAASTTEAGIRPLVDQARANRLAFLPANQIIIEKTTDGGNTWEDANFSDSVKRSFFSTGRPNIVIPTLNGERNELCGIRFIITGMRYNVPEGTPETEKYNFWNANYVISVERYFNVRQWWFWISAAQDRIGVQIYCATGAKPNNWATIFNKDFRMEGWSGSDWIRAGAGKTFGGGINQTGNYWNWKIVFWSKPQKNKTEFTGTTAQSIAEFRCYGDNVWIVPNNFMRYDHLYSWDSDKNATFPARVSASYFVGNGSLLTNLNGNAIINNLGANTTTPVDADYFISQSVNGGTSNTTYYRRPLSALWQYIKTKISSILGLTATTYNGSAAKVNNHTVESDVPANAQFTDTTYNNATSTSAGLMSAGDKIIVDGISSTYATKIESQNHIVASETQPTGQQAGDIWLVLS